MPDSAGENEETSRQAAAGIGAPIERQHASDHVFKELAAAILNRELEPGSLLPPERELSDRFGVSRIVVREAIHRLKEYELVRVRQGSPTTVLDPDRAIDIRLLGLEIDLVPMSREGVRAFGERQVYAGAALLDLAEQRMAVAEFDALEKIVDAFLVEKDKAAGWLAFERAFWTAIGRGTHNRILLREALWHFNLLERDPKFHETIYGDPMTRARLYKSLLETLRRRSGTAALYLNALRMAGALLANR